MHEYLARYLRGSQHLTFVALVATAALTFGLRQALGIPFPYELQAVLLVWVVMGVLSKWTADRAPDAKAAERVYFGSFLFGGLCATLVAHYSSGIEWIGPICYSFVVIYASLLLRPLLAGIVIGWSIALYGAMAALEYSGYLPHYRLFAPQAELFASPVYLLTMILLAGMLLALLGHALVTLARALSAEHRTQQHTSAKLEWLAETLEQRVNERTSELKRAQDQLVQAGKFAATGQLAAGLAREFNNPLAIVKGFADLVMYRYRDMLMESDGELAQLATYIEQIRVGAERCHNIVEAITQFANPAADREWTTFDVNDAVSAAVAGEHQRARRCNVQVLTHLGTNLPPVEGNAELLQQAVSAVVANAIDASRQGDCVWVRTMTEGVAQKMRQVVVLIDDYGDGIPEDELARVFEPFYSGKEVGAGLGLGLSVSEAIIREHSGSIEAEKLPDGGARFRITLPTTMRRAQEAPGGAASGGAIASRAETGLTAEAMQGK